ncbi:MAG: B12-binding domain-containing radical SAM protein [Candidatus Omnitrophica bacterium]|nr:B12-binding domain-containing radical SAM protein [Candidatus Omnitrophota bacterium]
MKILLVALQNAGSRPGYSGLFFPFGLAYVSAVLKRDGIGYDYIDLHTEQILQGGNVDAWEQISRFPLESYDAVCFGGTFMNFVVLKDLSQKILQKNDRIFQIAGGNMATMIADVILKETAIDCVCLHEGEETIAELIRAVQTSQNWKDVKGIKFLDENKTVKQSLLREKIKDLDQVPFPDRESWSFNIIRKAFPFGSPGRYCAIVFASRGCPFSCVFCSPGSGRTVRARSPKNIIEELKYLKEKWNVRYVRFFDEVFIANKSTIKEFCRLLKAEQLNIFWWCQTQIKLVDRDLLEVMRDAGCIEIAYGIESGCNDILQEMRKGITKEMAKEAIEMTYAVGIRPSLNLIAGTPSETYATLDETKEFIKSLNYINWVQIPTIDFIVPLPNTELFDIAVEKGIIKDTNKYLTEDLYTFDKYRVAHNLTQMPSDGFYAKIQECNKAIAEDHYKKHPVKRIAAFLGTDHLRWELMLKWFDFKQIKPLFEAILWATIGKRKNKCGLLVARKIYARA